MLRWAMFSASLLFVVVFATAVLVVFRALEVASPTRGGIGPSEVAGSLLHVIDNSAAVGFLSLVAATLFWMLRPTPASGAGLRTMTLARASLVVMPVLLYVAQMVAIWHVDEFLLGDPRNPDSSPQSGQVPTPTPVRAPIPIPAGAPWPVPQYPELTGPNVITYSLSDDPTIKNARRFVILGVRMGDGSCRMGPSPPHSAFPGDPIPAGRVLAYDPDGCRYLYEEGEYVGPPPNMLHRGGPTQPPVTAVPYRMESVR